MNLVSLHKKLLIIVILIVSIGENVERGRAAARVNNLNYFGIGARAMGLNNASTATCNDYSAPFWNPAAMGFFTTIKFGMVRNKMSLNRELNYLAFILPAEKYGCFALSGTAFGVHDIEARSSNSEEPDSYFSSTEKTFMFSYAHQIFSSFALGGNIKILNFGLQNTQAIGISTDLALFYVPYDKLRLGFMVQDIGSQLRWSSGLHEEFFTTYRIGCALILFNNVTLSCDFHHSQESKNRYSLGTEVMALKLIKLRCGIEPQRFACGLGFTLPVKNLYLTFNYAMATDRLEAGVSDVFDLSVVF